VSDKHVETTFPWLAECDRCFFLLCELVDTGEYADYYLFKIAAKFTNLAAIDLSWQNNNLLLPLYSSSVELSVNLLRIPTLSWLYHVLNSRLVSKHTSPKHTIRSLFTKLVNKCRTTLLLQNINEFNWVHHHHRWTPLRQYSFSDDDDDDSDRQDNYNQTVIVGLTCAAIGRSVR